MGAGRPALAFPTRALGSLSRFLQGRCRRRACVRRHLFVRLGIETFRDGRSSSSRTSTRTRTRRKRDRVELKRRVGFYLKTIPAFLRRAFEQRTDHRDPIRRRSHALDPRVELKTQFPGLVRCNSKAASENYAYPSFHE